MKKIIIICLSVLSILSCGIDDNEIKTKKIEIHGTSYKLNNIEITSFVDPETKVEYLLFYEKDKFHSNTGGGLGIGLAVIPRLNKNGTLRIIE